MSDSPDDERLSNLERGVETIFAADVANDVLAAIDFETLLSDQPIDQAIDVDLLADAIGRPLGRIVAGRLVGSGGLTGLAGRTVATEVGGRAIAETIRVAADQVDPDAVDGAAESVDDAAPGPSIDDLVDENGSAETEIPIDDDPESVDDTDPQSDGPTGN